MLTIFSHEQKIAQALIQLLSCFSKFLFKHLASSVENKKTSWHLTLQKEMESLAVKINTIRVFLSICAHFSGNHTHFIRFLHLLTLELIISFLHSYSFFPYKRIFTILTISCYSSIVYWHTDLNLAWSQIRLPSSWWATRRVWAHTLWLHTWNLPPQASGVSRARLQAAKNQRFW